jgi:hypothetical protein
MKQGQPVHDRDASGLISVLEFSTFLRNYPKMENGRSSAGY